VVLKLDIRNNIRNNNFFKLVKVGFSSKRKMLKNNLGNIYDIGAVEKALNYLNLDSKIRAQELSVEDWVEFYTQLDK